MTENRSLVDPNEPGDPQRHPCSPGLGCLPRGIIAARDRGSHGNFDKNDRINRNYDRQYRGCQPVILHGEPVAGAGSMSTVGLNGASLGSGGTVINQTGGTISGPINGVFITGGAGTVSNAGGIYGTQAPSGMESSSRRAGR